MSSSLIYFLTRQFLLARSLPIHLFRTSSSVVAPPDLSLQEEQHYCSPGGSVACRTVARLKIRPKLYNCPFFADAPPVFDWQTTGEFSSEAEHIAAVVPGHGMGAGKRMME